MLKSTPVQEVLKSLSDFQIEDSLTAEMLKDPYNIPLLKSRHATEGLPRSVFFLGFRLWYSDLIMEKGDADWWRKLFAGGVAGEESPTIARDRRFIVISHIMCVFSMQGNDIVHLRFDDFYSPTFWLELDFNAKTKEICKIAGRHVEASGFHMEPSVFPHSLPRMVMDPIAVSTRPRFRAKISHANVLAVWDEEHTLFEIKCDVTKIVNLFKE